mgnify:CR=1 FL=1
MIMSRSEGLLTLCMLLASISLFMSFPKVEAKEGQVEFVPCADTYTDILDPLSNYGGSYYLNIAYNEYAIQTVWLKFNLSHVPDGAIVDNATLKVFPTVVTATHEVSAYFCSNTSWEEYTINFINRPDFDDTALDKALVGMPNKWYSWNVTNAVRNSLNGVFNASDMLTIVLKQTQGHFSYRQLQIVSREYGIRVSLYVHWSGSVIPEISILSPENRTYAVKDIPLTFTISELISWMGYSLDSQINITISGNTTIPNLSDGLHTLVVFANSTWGYMGYSEEVYFTIDTMPPNIEIISPQNKTYRTSSISLNFTVDESTTWIGYSIDGQANQTIPVENRTISGLSNGSHTLRVYAKDRAGNIGASEIVHFIIQAPQLFPKEVVAVVVVAAIVGIVLLVYFTKIKKAT